MRTSWSSFALTCAALAFGACAAQDAAMAPSGPPAPAAPPAQPAPSAPPAPSVPPAAPALPAPEPDGAWQVIRSNGERYVLQVRLPAGGFARGTPLELDVRVAAAGDPTATLKDVALSLDADMPEHQHGLTRVPRIERSADGTFHVEGLYLHMPGWWELFFDVRQGPWTERAQMRVDLE